MISLNGSQATITEHVTGLAATFGGKPYPHVQHIHIGAKGTCPTTSADTNGDGVISTTEGAPSYGGIGTTLSTSGDTSPAAGTTLTVAPSGASIDYTPHHHPGLQDHGVADRPAPRSSSCTGSTRPPCARGAGREERPGSVAAAGRHLAGAVRHPGRLADVRDARAAPLAPAVAAPPASQDEGLLASVAPCSPPAPSPVACPASSHRCRQLISRS